ncbi:MAG: hypothetical protein ABI741_00075 [Ferruginibacter sp.]
MTITSCQKELHFENNLPFNDTLIGFDSGSAKFTLVGAPNECHHVVGGTYYVGTSLNPTNVVAIDINVTDTGTFFISTATQNGLSFQASGNLDNTGRQTILLKAIGMPVVPGTYTYKPGSDFCSFPITVGPMPTDEASGTLQCSHISSSGVFQQGIDLDSSKLYIDINVTTAGSYFINSAPVNGATFSGTGMLGTGPQTIELCGKGRPTRPGVYSFTVHFGATTCSTYLTFQ